MPEELKTTHAFRMRACESAQLRVPNERWQPMLCANQVRLLERMSLNRVGVLECRECAVGGRCCFYFGGRCPTSTRIQARGNESGDRLQLGALTVYDVRPKRD